jgi:hypothetical protein
MPVQVGAAPMINSYQDAGAWTATGLARTVVSCTGPWHCKQLVFFSLWREQQLSGSEQVASSFRYSSLPCLPWLVESWQAEECWRMRMASSCRVRLQTPAWRLLLSERCKGRSGGTATSKYGESCGTHISRSSKVHKGITDWAATCKYMMQHYRAVGPQGKLCI